jgi:sugar/nucleoside kinase (ribokinase family)
MSGSGGSGFDLLGLGMSVLDTIQVVGHFPVGAGVTRVLRSAIMGGGPVPTALCAASRLGAKAAILDRIGDDWRGERIREDYAKFGVDTTFLIGEPDRSTSLGTVLVRQSDGERHLLFEEGDFTPLTTAELPHDALAACRILHLNGRHWPACIDAARSVRERGRLVSFDGGAHRFDAKHLELFPLVDILIVAADYASRLAGTTSREDQLEALAQWGAEIVGITDGAAGSWFLTRDGQGFHQPAFPVDKVIDTTGCGDVFHGAFLFALLRGDPPRDASRLASATAAISAGGLGGRGRLPGLDEVGAMLNLPVAQAADHV